VDLATPSAGYYDSGHISRSYSVEVSVARIRRNGSATCRAFSPIDGLILSIAVGLALYLSTLLDNELMLNLRMLHVGKSPLGITSNAFEELELPARRIALDFLAFLSVTSVGMALVFFRRPASWRCPGLPSPGVAATAAAAVAVVHQVVERLLLAYYQNPGGRSIGPFWAANGWYIWNPYDWWPDTALYQIEAGATGAILGVWSLLLLSSRWRPASDWRDDAGRWLGWCWLSTLAFQALSIVLWG
jgi:hypothetical protein